MSKRRPTLTRRALISDMRHHSTCKKTKTVLTLLAFGRKLPDCDGAFLPCGVLSQQIWLIAWSQTAEKDCWAKWDIAASAKEGATRGKVRAFGRLAPIATQGAAGLLSQTQWTLELLRAPKARVHRPCAVFFTRPE